MQYANLFAALLGAAYAKQPHATTPEDPFEKYNISAPGIKASFIPYGARLTNLFVKDKCGNNQDVVLGYDTGREYLNDTETVHTYFGAVVGRYANRIENGTFTLDGEKYHIPENEHNGKDTLHGGFIGYDQRNWTVVNHQKDSITFMLQDHAYQGFPGDVVNYATYTVSEESTGPRWTSRMVSIPLTHSTPIMLANHVYWNMGAFINEKADTVIDDTLHIPYGDRYVEIDGIEVPTGQIGMTKNTPLDFTSPKTVGSRLNQTVDNCGTGCTGYDNAYILDRPRSGAPEGVDITQLSMSSPETGIKMDVRTNQRSLQIYTCNGLDGTIVAKTDQQHGEGITNYEQYSCIVVETQQWIDGINNPQWGQHDYQIFSPTTEPAVNFATYDFGVME